MESVPDIKITYVENFPIERINIRKPKEETPWRIALANNIKENGLKNPLIILNHEEPKRKVPYWLMVGQNRLWAIKYLGWRETPAIVTGVCEFAGKEVSWEDLPKYFKDGVPYRSPYGIALKDVTDPEKEEYPK